MKFIVTLFFLLTGISFFTFSQEYRAVIYDLQGFILDFDDVDAEKKYLYDIRIRESDLPGRFIIHRHNKNVDSFNLIVKKNGFSEIIPIHITSNKRSPIIIHLTKLRNIDNPPDLNLQIKSYLNWDPIQTLISEINLILMEPVEDVLISSQIEDYCKLNEFEIVNNTTYFYGGLNEPVYFKIVKDKYKRITFAMLGRKSNNLDSTAVFIVSPHDCEILFSEKLSGCRTFYPIKEIEYFVCQCCGSLYSRQRVYSPNIEANENRDTLFFLKSDYRNCNCSFTGCHDNKKCPDYIRTCPE